MATFKDLKKQSILNNPTTSIKESPTPLKTPEENTQFELEEARYMLKLIADSNFKGSEVQVVYNLALKLQTIIQELNNG